MKVRAETSAVVLVEGVSDQVAIQTLAERRGIDLAAAGIQLVRLGGAHRIARVLAELGEGPRVTGLCDLGEEPVFRRALEGAGRGRDLTRDELERLGFYTCVVDLEDELIRALGAAAVEELLRRHDDLRRFRTLQQMPQWRGRPVEEQLRRFMGSGGRRKIRYARIFVDALELDDVPRPLDGVLASATGTLLA
jgi:Overcoming lysogenization defect protein-like, TOPRIM domain